MKRFVGIILFVIVGASARNVFTDEANARLPRLFHLDDYERCLSHKDGLYCLGEFELSPVYPSPIYEHIQEYSSNPFAFNRSRLHRGYCVSERCPSTERNATVRFERCVSERAHRHALTARLHTLHHCTSHVQHTATPPHTHTYNQLTFIQIVAALLALNVLGTVYDVATGDDQKKIGILSAWSIRASWRCLTVIHKSGDPRIKELEVINGVRVIVLLLTLFAHTYAFYFQYHVTNPQFLEYMSFRPDGVLLSIGLAAIQVFFLISNFLLGYHLLIYLETHTLNLTTLPLLVIKRFARIAPVNILIIRFLATWWPRMYSGPFHSQIEEQSTICRNKFWSHVFFYNNIVDKNNNCLIPSWSLPVDMHLYILACTLVIIMQHRRQQARRLFGFAFIVSSLACGLVSYVTGWKAMLYYTMSDVGRGFFKNVESFSEFYISTWGSLPSCFLGLYMAYLYYDLSDMIYENKSLRLLHNLSIPLMVMWMINLGTIVRQSKEPLVYAAHVAIDRPEILVFMMFFIIGLLKIKGLRRALTSRFLRIPARLSLPVMLGHWLIINYIAARPYAYHTSEFSALIDFVATVVLSHLMAIPISLLVEIPTQSFISQLI